MLDDDDCPVIRFTSVYLTFLRDTLFSARWYKYWCHWLLVWNDQSRRRCRKSICPLSLRHSANLRRRVGRKYPVTWRIYGRYAWRTQPYVGCEPCRRGNSFLWDPRKEQEELPSCASRIRPALSCSFESACFTNVYSTHVANVVSGIQKSWKIVSFFSRSFS